MKEDFLISFKELVLLNPKDSKGFKKQSFLNRLEKQSFSKSLENSKNHQKSKISECAQKSKAFLTFQNKIKNKEDTMPSFDIEDKMSEFKTK